MTKTKDSDLLTPTEKNYWETIKATPGPTLRRYVDPSGAKMYRLVDEKINPVINIPTKIIDALIAKGRLEVVGDRPKAI